MTLGLDVLAATALSSVGVRLFASPDARYRVANPIYHHDLRPNVECTATWGPFEYPMRTNSLGFRDGEVRALDLTARAGRILLIGDSFTEGIGVPFEASFAGILRAELAPHGLEVLDAGVVSYAPIIYERKVRHLLETVGLQFARLIVCIDLSDVHDEATCYRTDAHGAVIETDHRGVAGAFKAFVDEHTVVLKGLRRMLAAWRQPGRPDATNWRAATGIPRACWTVDAGLFATFGAVGLERATEHMNALRDLVRAHGIAMTVVVYPWPDQVLHADLDSKHVRHWAAWCAEHAVDFVDCFPAFLDSAESADALIRRYYLPGDSHFNAAGHRVVADCILRSLAR